MADIIDEINDALEELEASRGPNTSREVWDRGQALLASEGRQRRTRANDALTLYHGNTRYSFDHAPSLSSQLGWLEPPGYNLIQAAVDTKTAHIVRNQVHPMFLTERGDSEIQEKAKGMERAVETVLETCGVYGHVGVSVCRDGQLFEAGGMKFIPDYENGRVLGERVFAHDVLVDPQDAKYGNPRQLWHVEAIDRRVLLKRWGTSPEAIRAIERAPSAPYSSLDRAAHQAGEISDRVLVMEYWRLPAGRVDSSQPSAFGRDKEGNLDPSVDPGHDGLHTVCIEGAPLLEEPWPFEYFPIAWFRPMRTSVGYWSRSLPETLAGAQLEINRLNDRIGKILHLIAVPRIFVSKNARINKAKLTNEVGAIYEVQGSPHQAVYVYAPTSVPNELFRRIDDITRWAEKQIGLSELSIGAIRPKGIDHAPGLQHLADTESLRAAPEFRSWEEFHLEAARIIVDCFRMLDQYGETDLELLWGNSKELRRIRWKDVDLQRDQYHIRIHPTNKLPQTPGARKSFVLDMYNAGIFGKAEALRALEFPDVDALLGDTTARLEAVEKRIAKAKRGEDFASPDPYLDLELAATTALDTINRMDADGEDEEKIDRVRQWYEDTLELINRQRAQEAALAAPPDAAAPPGPPGPEMPPSGPLPPEMAPTA